MVSTIEANIAQRGNFLGLNKYNPAAAITKSMEGIYPVIENIHYRLYVFVYFAECRIIYKIRHHDYAKVIKA